MIEVQGLGKLTAIAMHIQVFGNTLEDWCLRIATSDSDQDICLATWQHRYIGLERNVPVLPGRETDVLVTIAGRDPEAPVFERIPKHLDVHSYRREFAQALYLYHAPSRTLPPAIGRLKPS